MHNEVWGCAETLPPEVQSTLIYNWKNWNGLYTRDYYLISRYLKNITR